MKRIVYVCLVALIATLVTTNPLTDEINVSEGPNGLILPRVTTEVVRKYLRLAQQYMAYIDVHDKSLQNFGVQLTDRAPGFDMFTGGPQSKEFTDGDYSSEIITKGLSFLAKDACFRSDLTTGQFIRKLMNKGFRVDGICQVINEPDPNLVRNVMVLSYRTFQGDYNNLDNPSWGKVGTAFPRLVAPEYANGIDSPRVAKSGRELPNARRISLNIFPSSTIFDENLSVYTTFMSQMVAHDAGLQVMDKNQESPIACCSQDLQCPLSKISRHKSCIPIKISKDDPFYSKHDIKCFNFIRSVAAPRTDCLLSWREQINAVSGYLDLSVVYGSSKNVSESLRVKQNGHLRESPDSKHHLPPCSTNDKNFCYVAGDTRCNQQIYLASLHMILLREHNRIADILLKLNPNWNDETLYQESRRILIAVYHHIVYWELLPVLFGRSFPFDIFGELDRKGFSSCYDPSMNGAVHNEFTMAFRSLHTLIPGVVTVCQRSRHCFHAPLSDNIGNMTFLEEDPEGLDDTYRGMSMNADKFDRFITSEMTSKVLKNSRGDGADILMADIQRGRDHGTPSYNSYRKFCGLNAATTFEDLLDSIPERDIAILKVLYESPDDIDLIVGGLVERSAVNTVFGPTLYCILKNQFVRSACGDRFNYLNRDQKYPFSSKQLWEIKKMTMASLICLNSDDIKSVPQNVFLVESAMNPAVFCSEVPVMDFTPWMFGQKREHNFIFG